MRLGRRLTWPLESVVIHSIPEARGGVAVQKTMDAANHARYTNSGGAYERTSLIVTTNLPFENWTEVLGSERLTGATLDRLTHRCNNLDASGESYRLQDARRRQTRIHSPNSAKQIEHSTYKPKGE